MFQFLERKNGSVKSLSLSNTQGWQDVLAPYRDDGTITPQGAYAGVPFVYRAINLRAYALASLPFSLARGGRELDKEGEEYITLSNTIRQWLFSIEANLCIFGAAYLLIERNRYGRNPTPRPVLPTTITPMYEMPSGELAYFERITNGVSMRVELEDMLHFWLHSFQHENAPGTSPLSACLGSAATLHNLGRFAQQFFANGALIPTVFFFGDGSSGMPSTTTPQEIENFLERMKRVISGIRNAWKFEALRGNVTAQQIGTPPNEVAAPELTTISRQDVAVAFGIPESLLLSTSSTYASASADRYHIYDLVVIPEAEAVVLPVLQRWLDMVDLSLIWQPEMLESYQSYQQQQATSLSQLVGHPVLTVDEARALMGYGPMPKADEEETGSDVQLTEAIFNSGALSVNELRGRLGLEPVDTSADEQQRTLSRQFELLKQATGAGLSIEQAAEIIGLVLPEIEEPEPEEPEEDPDAANDFEQMEAEADAELDEDEERDGGNPQSPPEGKSAAWLKVYELKRKPGGGHWQQQPRDARGRFARMAGTGGRSEERGKLRLKQQRERQELQSHQRAERAATPRAERHTLRERHASERQQLRQRHAVERGGQRLVHREQRQQEVDAHLAEMRRNNPKAMTRAYGNDPNRAYEMRTRVVDLGEVKASNTATGAVNPDYDQTLQPCDRTRAASQMQIDNVARNMVSDAVLVDFHQIDKGSPIVDADGNVLSGNGRTLALQRMKERYPEKWREYQDHLRRHAKAHSISEAELSQMQNPVLVRELMGDHDRVAFAREANNPPVLQMSPLERAKIERDLITDKAIHRLDVRDGESVDQALRRSANQPFVQEFMQGLSENERATMLRADGTLNRAGIERVKAAMYSKALPGQAGERLADTFLESLDSDIKNFESAVSAQLPSMVKARNLMARGDRSADLDITSDLAGAIDVLSRIREQGKLTVPDYLNQEVMFGERELSPRGERLLAHFDKIGRKPKEIREFIGRWAQEVEKAPHPNQTGLFDDGHISTDELIDRLLGEDNRQRNMF